MKLEYIFVLFLILTSAAGARSQSAPVPNPILVFTGSEDFENSGKQFTRYTYEVFNRADIPDVVFAASPELPPCGKNNSASRTWVDVYDQGGKRLNGFCALKDGASLGRVWFVLEKGVLPPSWVYIELADRKTNTKYKSNLAESVM